MATAHLVKIGLFGQVGRLTTPGGRLFSRNDRVVCRTSRGLEVGTVLCADELFRQSDDRARNVSNGGTDEPPTPQFDGEVLRRLTPDDHLIMNRIERFRDKAFTACNELLVERGLKAVLVDVEHLFDGQSLFFYFLGEVPEQVHRITDELAETYEKKVRFKKFTETLASGCGPDCGTGASKCSTGGCSSCSAKSVCKSAVAK